MPWQPCLSLRIDSVALVTFASCEVHREGERPLVNGHTNGFSLDQYLRLANVECLSRQDMHDVALVSCDAPHQTLAGDGDTDSDIPTLVARFHFARIELSPLKRASYPGLA